EVSRHREIARQVRCLEVADARRAHAGRRELVVEPCCGTGAEVGTEGLVQGREDVEQHEHDADDRERCGERRALLNGADQYAHRDREEGGEEASEYQDRPPRDRQRAVRAWERGEERPMCALLFGHANCRWYVLGLTPNSVRNVRLKFDRSVNPLCNATSLILRCSVARRTAAALNRVRTTYWCGVTPVTF